MHGIAGSAAVGEGKRRQLHVRGGGGSQAGRGEHHQNGRDRHGDTVIKEPQGERAAICFPVSLELLSVFHTGISIRPRHPCFRIPDPQLPIISVSAGGRFFARNLGAMQTEGPERERETAVPWFGIVSLREPSAIHESYVPRVGRLNCGSNRISPIVP